MTHGTCCRVSNIQVGRMAMGVPYDIYDRLLGLVLTVYYLI